MSLNHHRRLQIEQIRAIEQNSEPYPSGHFDAANLEAYLDTRAQYLKQSYRLETPLNLASVWYGRIFTLILIIGLMSGAAAVLKAVESNDNTLNIFWIIVVLLGFNTVSLLLWLAVSLWPRSNLKSPIGNLFHSLLTWAVSLSRSEGVSVVASKTWLEWQLGSQPGRWLLGATVHLFWLFFLIGGLAMLVITLSTRQYDFVWGSTILSNQAFSNITNILSIPMEWLNWPAPSNADLLASQIGTAAAEPMSSAAATETRASWGYFLIGCLALFGMVPRIAAWFACILIRKLCLKNQTLDLTQPYYIKLQHHWHNLSRTRLILDKETTNATHTTINQHYFSHRALPSKALWLGLELTPSTQSYANQAQLINIIDKATTQQAMDALKSAKVPIVLLVNGQKPPDRGMTRLLKNLVELKPKTAFWLVCALAQRFDSGKNASTQSQSPTDHTGHLNAWQKVASAIAISTEQCAILEVHNRPSDSPNTELGTELGKQLNKAAGLGNSGLDRSRLDNGE